MATEDPIDGEKLGRVLFNLLDKAGEDKRLTLKLLRDKAESKLKLEHGDLKSKKNLIVKIIMKWWNVKNATLSQYTRLAKGVGKGPSFFSEFKDMNTGEKTAAIREKLLESGLVFSDPPTDQEIHKITKDHQIKKELEDLGVKAPAAAPTAASSSSVSSGSKKRSVAAATEGAEVKKSEAKKAAVGPIPVKKIMYNSSDEEADF